MGISQGIGKAGRLIQRDTELKEMIKAVENKLIKVTLFYF